MGNIKTRKANGNGHTYKVGGSWKTVIEVGGRKISATNKSQQESRRIAKERAESARNSNKGIIPGAYKVTLEQHLVPFMELNHSHNIADTTLTRYLGICRNYIIPALGKLHIQKITKHEIVLFMNSLARNKVGGRTANQALSILSVAFKAAVEAGLIQNNPTDGVPDAPVREKPINPLSEDEVRNLLTSSKGTYMHARLHIAFNGLRQGEALGLRWSDIDFFKSELQLSKQIQKVGKVVKEVPLKSKASVRQIALSEETINALKRHKSIVNAMRLKAGDKWNENDYVFPDIEGKPLNSKTDWRRWKSALQKCGIKDHRLHDARHTTGTLLYANGEGIETIRRVLGHSSVNLTSRTYVHADMKPLRKAANTMNGVFGGGNSSAAS